MIKRFRFWLAAKIAGDIGPCLVADAESIVHLERVTFPGHEPFRSKEAIFEYHATP